MKLLQQMFAATQPEGGADNVSPIAPSRVEDASMAQVIDNEFYIRNTIKNDAEKGYELLFKRYYKPLCSHAVRFVYSKEIAEDLVSDLFVNLWRKKHFENITTSYRAYLYQSLRNTIYNYLKSEYGRKSNSIIGLGNGEEEMPESNTPQRVLLFDELFQKIEEAVHGFPPQCQKVFLLSRYEGLKNREIAEQLNIRPKTVEAHMMKALSMLKSALANYLK